MDTNDTNEKESKIIYPDLSFSIVGVCFGVHNELGRYSKEKQYCDLIEEKLKQLGIRYQREAVVENTGNRVDFVVEDKVILEVKAKQGFLKSDYYQTQRYLQILNKKLGFLVNFRSRYLKPTRIIRIDTDVRKKFV